MNRSVLSALLALTMLAPLWARAQDQAGASIWQFTGSQKIGGGLGKAIGYRSRGGAVATFYIYDRDLPVVPTGTDSRLVRSELERCKAALVEFRTGQGWDVREVSQQIVPLGSGENAPSVLCVTYELQHHGRVLLSQLYLMGHQNKFLKIRTTYPADNQAVCEEEIDVLMETIVEALTE
jgi:hypothetical protein